MHAIICRHKSTKKLFKMREFWHLKTSFLIFALKSSKIFCNIQFWTIDFERTSYYLHWLMPASSRLLSNITVPAKHFEESLLPASLITNTGRTVVNNCFQSFLAICAAWWWMNELKAAMVIPRPLARLHTVSGSSHQPGRSPSSVSDIAPTRMFPGLCTLCLVCWWDASRRTCS